MLLELGATSAYRPLWSERIESEVARAITRLRERHGCDSEETAAYVKRLMRQMNAALPDARVLGWEGFEQRSPHGPDPNDRHVVAAAMCGRADVIVTFNLKDFPESALPGELFAQHPDEFLCDLLDLNPQLVVDSMRSIVARTGRKGPKWTMRDLLTRLERESVEDFVAEFRGGAVE